MTTLIAIVGGVFAITFLAAPTLGGGWYWDAGNAIGFAALAGMLTLGVTSSRGLNRREQQQLGYGVLALAALHAFWFLLGDPVAAEFLKPGAPGYMWLGVAALLLLAVLVVVALTPDRQRLHADYASFRYWHRLLAVTAVAAATYHIVVSDFYLRAWYQVLLFVVLVAATGITRIRWLRSAELPTASATAFLATSAVFIALFTIVRSALA